jgi:hypothetical protein
MRRSGVDWLVALGALAWVVVGSVNPAQGYTAGPPSPAAICVGAVVANEAVLEASVGPSNDASVQAGTPVTFSGYSGSPVSFAVASSPALLLSPDIDSGAGSAQPERLYTFTSTKATVAPGTIYWEASFSSETLKGCEGLTPSTYTTKVRTLTVLPLPSPATTPVIPATTTPPPPAATGSVSLNGSTIAAQRSGEAQVRLACTGTRTCTGKLLLAVKGAAGKGKRFRMRKIAEGSFSVPAGKVATIELRLNGAGRARLGADHGRVGATLTIFKLFPATPQVHSASVWLVREKPAAASAVAATSGSESSGSTGSTEGPLTGCTSVETCRGPPSPQPEFNPPPSETPGSGGPSSPAAPAPPATGGLALAADNLSVRGAVALVNLNCLGSESCHGKLTLTAKSSVKAKGAEGKKARAVTIGTMSFSIAGDETKTLKITIDAAGTALLKVHHGRLSASLAVLESSPGPSQTHIDSVHLIQQKADKARRP